jgi:acid phosphatase
LAPDKRIEEARKYHDRFGSKWFLLPNPVYGSWESVLYNRDDPDAKQLTDKINKVTGY